MSKVNVESQCTYVLRFGKNKDTRCTSKISKKQPETCLCSKHLNPRVKKIAVKTSPKGSKVSSEGEEVSSEGEEVSPTRTGNQEWDAKIDASRLSRFEERFLKEKVHREEEAVYREWKMKRMSQ